MRARLAWILFFLVLGCSSSSGPEVPTVAPDAFEKPRETEAEEVVTGAPAKDAQPAPPAVPGRITLPPDGGDWPVIAATRIQSVPVPLTHLLTGSLHPQNVAVSPVSGRAIVTLWESDVRQKKDGTHLFWCDLNTGKVTHTWDASTQYLAAFDIHPDGRQFLLKRHDFSDRDRHTLHLWEVADDGRLQRREWDPYYAGQTPDGEPRENDAHHMRRREADVIWAAFAGRQHVVTVCAAGEMKVWERDSLKQVGMLPNVVGLPSLTNDGERVVFVTGERVAVLDPKSQKVTAIRNIGKPPDNPVVTFRADGKRLGIVGTGRATILNIETGGMWDEMLPELRLEYHSVLPEFGWVGSHTLYFRGDLYDLPVPIKVWHYGVPHSATVRGGHVWAVTHALGEKEVALRAFTLPHPRAEQTIAAVTQRTDVFALRPGDSVRIDVAGVPQNRQKEVREVLERRVRDLGYRLESGAATAFVASVDSSGQKVTKTYTVGKSQVTGTYEERFARLKVIQNSRILWEDASTDSPGLLVMVPNDTDPAEYIGRFGSPNYDLFSKRKLPGLLRVKDDSRPLGSSQLTSAGISER